MIARLILTPMRLLLVRHTDALPGEPDELRPLSADGRAAARELGQRLADEGIRPGAILTSPLLRARETGEALAAALGCESDPSEALAPGTTADAGRAAPARSGDTVLAAAHQPDCGPDAAEITRGSRPACP